jgi:small-conductance mechanosensitive channel/CRP-like cAMP-binding protein
MGAWRIPARRSAAVLLLALGLELLAGQQALRGLHQVAVLVLGLVLVHLGGLVFFRVLLPALHVAAPRILEDVAVFGGYVLWSLVRLSEAGVELSGLVATSALITAVVAFAMQDTLGNILGGLALQLDDSFELGDWLLLDGVSGRVVQIQWRFTALLTRNGERVVVPNGQLMKARFSVVGAAEPGAGAGVLRRWVGFHIGDQVPPSAVTAAAEHALVDAEIPNVARTPAPSCVVMDFAPGSLRYALRYWLLDPRDDDATDSAVRTHLHAMLQRQGWRIALPGQAVHLLQDDAAQREAAWQHELARREQALAAIDLFAPLDGAERRHVAARLVHAPFVRGDVMTRQGAVAHWLYIIASGEADVVLETPGGERRTLKHLPAGSLFGEMGLMTGAPRSATVLAATDVDCYRLDKAGFEEVLRGRHEIAESMAHILAQRQHENEAMLDTLRQAPAGPGAHRAAILARMREFFGLG